MTKDIAIIGDQFMLSDIFEKAILEACGDRVQCRKLDFGWPDEPIEQGYTEPRIEGLREYQGDPEVVIEHIGDAPVLVTHHAPVSAAMMDRMPQLRLIAVARGGPVNVDIAAARERGITVVNTPGRNASAVAEFTIGAMIAEIRNLSRGHEAMKAGNYRTDLYRADVIGDELCDMTVGVIGYGHIGSRVVSILRAFGCRILVSDPYVQLSVDDLKDGVEQVSLDTLLAQSDVVSLHPRVTEETTGMMNAEAFAKMKKGAYVINTARGPLMDYDAVVEALQSGHLRGAMLETFAFEPVPEDSPLLTLPNVTLTPHIAGASLRTVRVAAGKAAEEIRRWLDGEPPVNPS
ncbi:2-hydroxyacid dehydrogenase [Paracoccus seriniphilus]|uniref:D-3-phosphoglycerate dehydrogenase n=1 Tax=Paracoccus seriniphilus TaxID=184748 RepID=A0A239PUG0_9RHOB|nr:2-hydroxyacid dehydrogenase [Paracoccus seriniphilus]WCR16491.1 2-hydroxyacid dehydrogenase [Paracoccus seriniphilus]SNT73663.1 D-3-phosphoglycerate dehydrogenase [Paracoccus seriniphilus]